VTMILLIFGETTPKTIATRHSERLSIKYARSIEILTWLFTPFVYLLSWFSGGITRMVGGKPVPKSLASPEEIQTMISLGHKDGMVEESEARMLHRVFDFGDRPVREVMVPRPEVVSIGKGSTISDFLKLYVKTPLSRFPVYEGGMDHIAGILSVKDVLMALAKGSMTYSDVIDSMIRPAYFTPESKRVSEVFAEMRDKNMHMCVVVDEYGGTAGVCSLGGLIEEIVGPMGDELAESGKEYEEIDEHTWQIDGSMRTEEANSEMGLKLPEGDYETVAGFVLHLLGRIPRPNEQIRYKNLKIVITEMRGFKIERILITREKVPETEGSGKEKNKEAPYEV
jgi:putative hemolysin